jgi:hypothetical protein
MSGDPEAQSAKDTGPAGDREALALHFRAILPALEEWDAAWRSSRKTLRIPGRVGGRKWQEVEGEMRRVAELEERVADSLAAVSTPARLRKVHAGLIAALRISAKTFFSNARDMRDGVPMKEWTTVKAGAGDPARFKRLVTDWRALVAAEARRLDVPIPFRRLWVFRHSL